MDFEPTEDQRTLCESIREFGKSLNDGMIECDAEGVFDRELWKKCAEFGIVGLPVPTEYGGSGQDFTTTLLAWKPWVTPAETMVSSFPRTPRCGPFNCR